MKDVALPYGDLGGVTLDVYHAWDIYEKSYMHNSFSKKTQSHHLLKGVI